MRIGVIIHKAEEGGYWAEVPAIPGCATQGETLEELKSNVLEAGKAACRSKSLHATWTLTIKWLKWLYGGCIRQGILQRLDLSENQGQSHVYTKPGHVERISVPVHANKALKMGLQKTSHESGRHHRGGTVNRVTGFAAAVSSAYRSFSAVSQSVSNKLYGPEGTPKKKLERLSLGL